MSNEDFGTTASVFLPDRPTDRPSVSRSVGLSVCLCLVYDSLSVCRTDGRAGGRPACV